MKRGRNTRDGFSDEHMARINAAVASRGFIIIPEHVDHTVLTPQLIAKLKRFVRTRKGLGPIFNGGVASSSDASEEDASNYGDLKRKQIFFRGTRWSAAKDEAIPQFVRLLKERVAHVLPERIPADHVLLLSEVGCAHQAPHIDFDDVKLTNCVVDDGVCGGYPMGCLVALEDNTFFNVWPGTIDFDPAKAPYPYERVTLRAGDVLLFRADLVHSGAAFEECSNIRMHCFLDIPWFKRADNYTGIAATEFLAPVE